MSRMVIASLRKNAGKTSLIVGLCKVLRKRFGYMKPIGDRLIYRKKQLWDYDAALLVNVFSLGQDAQKITLGFEQSKLRYTYDRETIEKRLEDMAVAAEHGQEILILEGGRDLAYGCSVHLDALSVARKLDARLVILVDGDENSIFDDVAFLKGYLNVSGLKFQGIVINKVPNLEDFKDAYLPEIEKLDIPVLGAIPFEHELVHLTMGFLAEKLLGKVLSGERRLANKVKTILVGAMTGEQLFRSRLLKKENKLFITSGDRTDMLLAALQEDAIGVILTNNVLPPAKIISQFEDRCVPLILTQPDTWTIAHQLSELEPLLTQDDDEKIACLESLVSNHVKVDAFLE